MPIIRLRKSLLFLVCWVFLSWKDVGFCQILFSASLEIFTGFLYFVLLMWCISLIHFLFKNIFWFFMSLFLKYFHCCSSTVVSISPHYSPPMTFPPLTLDPTPLWLCPCILYRCSLTTLSPFPPISPFHLPSSYCQFFLYFNVSGYILPACLLCQLGSTYRWDHMVFVFHCLAYFI